MEKKIDSIFEIWHDTAGAGGQVLVTHKGKVIFDKCYGYANLETGTPITQDSIFYIASISKMITGMAIMMLQEQGKLHVDDDVRKYVPEYVGFAQKVTLRQLLDHTSGFRCHIATRYLQGMTTRDVNTYKETLSHIARQKDLSHAPGEKFTYSNPNYVLLAAVVEKVTGEDFRTWIQENIFIPLGMEDSFIPGDPAKVIPNKVSSYNDNGYRYKTAIISCGVYGSTGVYSTGRDLTKFMLQFQKPTLVSQKTLEEVAFRLPEVKVGTTITGGGVRVSYMEGHRHLHHGGVKGGNRTIAMIFPEDELVVTIFANTHNLPVETSARDVARVVLDLPRRKLKNLDEYKKDSADLSKVAGLYRTPGYSLYEFDVQGEQVFCDGVPLEHLGGNLYKQGRLNRVFAIGDTIMKLENNLLAELVPYEPVMPAALAEEFVGTYYNEDCDALWKVIFDGENLFWEHSRHGKQLLRHLEGETFYDGAWRLTLMRDDSGKLTGFRCDGRNLQNVIFQKMK